MVSSNTNERPEGVFSILDTDLYKLTMQCCIIQYYPGTKVKYNYTNRTPDMKFTRNSVKWLQHQVEKLANLRITDDEIAYLRKRCKYLPGTYLAYLKSLILNPAEQVDLKFHPDSDTGSDDDIGSIELHVSGLWAETILYEIPLLALVSETYFRFIDRDWSHEGQVENALEKGRKLLQGGCVFSEFGSRRRRDYKTQALVLEGLSKAAEEGKKEGWPGKLSGTSNVHFAMRFDLEPVGTVAHEWFMGVAAITDDYEHANELALRKWVGSFGEGVLSIALTDTFGTRAFLNAFKKPMGGVAPHPDETFAQSFAGVRQDSGDPEEFIGMMRDFYDSEGIQKKTMVFSDSLNVDKCLEYKASSEKQGFTPTFGVGTFLTNDFSNLSNGKKSVPLNIVIKLGSAAGNPAIKLSDNIGKNTGDQAKVEDVKRRLGYVEQTWSGGDESTRWGKAK